MLVEIIKKIPNIDKDDIFMFVESYKIEIEKIKQLFDPDILNPEEYNEMSDEVADMVGDMAKEHGLIPSVVGTNLNDTGQVSDLITSYIVNHIDPELEKQWKEKHPNSKSPIIDETIFLYPDEYLLINTVLKDLNSLRELIKQQKTYEAYQVFLTIIKKCVDKVLVSNIDHAIEQIKPYLNKSQNNNNNPILSV